ncbi:MAG: helicase, partial [Labilithrix sp.]|nr:helicase [Labilithrix sp.]
MAREQASVAPPPRVSDDTFSPHPVLRPAAPDGSALSLRMFSDVLEDATALVLGDATSHRFDPIPPRAGPLFEAHAALKATEVEDELVLGFPLATFVQQGSARVAPLFSRSGARARWMIGEAAWALPPNARAGAALPLPDALVLEVVGDEGSYALHGGVWHSLFGLDGATLASIGAAARDGVGALVRAATRALETGGEEDADADVPVGAGPLTRDELLAFCEAAAKRAQPSRALRCYPHGIAMLPPRGDPTSALRTDLRALLDEPALPRGPLAVYLGATGAPVQERSVWASARVAPTASQLAAARAFEGSEDLVAVCGPPGCGKTALLHHVTAQTVVTCALGNLWVTAPPRAMPWALVVTSTNNAAVDHALAPFVRAPAIPLALRLGNRRTLAEVTADAIAAVLAAIEAPGEATLADARAAFEARAQPVRAYLREQEAKRASRASDAARRRELELRAATLREMLARMPDGAPPDVPLAELDEATRILREHAEAASRLAKIHLDGKNPSVARACEKWAKANDLRAPRIEPVLRALSLETPFGALDPERPREDVARQQKAIEATLAQMTRARDLLGAPESRRELAELEATLAHTAAESVLPPDAALYDAALAVRDAWARAHRVAFVRRLSTALAAARGERSGGWGQPLSYALQELAPLFPLAGCTLLSMRAGFPLERDVIDRLVIDEAAQCAPVYAVPALARARRAMLTGDTAQLPPVYTLDPRVDERISRGLDDALVAPFRMSATSTSSAQAVAEPRARARIALVEHFRSQRPIVALASRWSGYSLDVRTPERSLADVSPRLAAPIVTVPVVGRGERAPEGVVNAAEAEYAVDLVAELLGDGVEPSDIAVLTPFVGQNVRIERELLARGLMRRGGVLVSTVHRLQGGERRVVVFSVTATQRRHLRWLGERPHLLHVATSRAQDHLVVLMDPDASALEPALAPLRE